jgi:alpha-N-acetylglucosaminidase
MKLTTFVLLLLSLYGSTQKKNTSVRKENKEGIISLAETVSTSRAVIRRLIGDREKTIRIEYIKSGVLNDTFEVRACLGHLTVQGNSVVAICHGFYQYLKNYCHCMVTWGSEKPIIPVSWPDCVVLRCSSPYKYRNYLNVVTYGYTMPYWNWARWEKELDWMALHGVNMPLALVASEAIAARVWDKLGVSPNEISTFFSGPAYLPWHRMGNINKWNGPIPDSWWADQLHLQHLILHRMIALGMHPVTPAFAGFVPVGFKKLHPELPVNELQWGGFPKDYHAYVLAPGSSYFSTIGRLFIVEWEKEFGKNIFYLSDSFNEMDVPVPKNDTAKKYALLADYGASIYKSIVAGDPDAVWITQGWTFGYQHQFWNKASLCALLSKVPDDKMMIIDLGCEYPSQVWHIPPVWETHEGFYGKNWIYSYVPNFGGKTPYTGMLALYASASAKAWLSPYHKNLVGFGMAPEGLENNEVVYELLSDMGWTKEAIDTGKWISSYCVSRYGGYSVKMKEAWSLLQKTCYGSFTPYPRFEWQLVKADTFRKGAVNSDTLFLKAVEDFLDVSGLYKGNKLYRNDAIELTVFYLGIKADAYFKQAQLAGKEHRLETKHLAVQKGIKLLLQMDRLLESHPLDRLSPWVKMARGHGRNLKEKNYYESDAKRLITTWGGKQNDYAARVWSGLIRDYYVPRLQYYYADATYDLSSWENTWVQKPGISQITPYADPVATAKKLIAEERKTIK